MHMNELFVINDYDTREPFEFIITDNAKACKKLLQDFEQKRFEDDMLEWDYYYDMLERNGISFHIVQKVESYNY